MPGMGWCMASRSLATSGRSRLPPHLIGFHGGPSLILKLHTIRVYQEASLSLKNGHLHITPEAAPRRLNSLADMAGSRIHIGDIHRRHLGTQIKNVFWRHRSPVRPVDA